MEFFANSFFLETNFKPIKKIFKIILCTLLFFAIPTSAKTPIQDNPWNLSFIQSSYTPWNPPVALNLPRGEEITRNWDYLLSKYSWPVFEARSIMMCESGGNPNSVGDKNTAYRSYGLFQIRALPGRPSPEWLLVPENNISYAYSLYQKSGWSPWTCSRVL